MKILCPVDFSNAANAAIEYAANYAKQTKADLELLHLAQSVAFQTASDVESIMPMEARLEASRERLATYASMIKDEYGVIAKLSVKSDAAGLTQSLRKEIVENDYDLIIMGTNGANDMNQLLFGSHTYKIIRKISKPLLLVPEGYAYEDPKRVVYASDYNREDMDVLNYLLSMTDRFNSAITLLHFDEHSNKNSKEIFEYFEDVYRDHLKSERMKFERIIGKEIPAGIDHYMHEAKANLLALTTHHYSFFEQLFHQSVTRKLAYIADYPILVYQTEN